MWQLPRWMSCSFRLQSNRRLFCDKSTWKKILNEQQRRREQEKVVWAFFVMKRSGDMPKKYPHFKTSTVDKKWDKILMLRHCFEHEKKVFADSASSFEKNCFIFSMQYHYYHFSVHICLQSMKIVIQWTFFANFKRWARLRRKVQLAASNDQQTNRPSGKTESCKSANTIWYGGIFSQWIRTISKHMQIPFPSHWKKKRILNFLSKYFPFLEYYVFSQKENVPLLEKWYVIKIHFRFKPFLYMYYSQTFAPYKNFRHLGCSVQ